MQLRLFMASMALAGLGLLTAGCSDPGGNANPTPTTDQQAADNAAADQRIAAYLKFKRVPDNDEKRRAAVREQYLEREALAAAIENTHLLDPALVQAELSEFRQEMLISRYFEQYLRKNVTDEAVRNHYAAHPEEFQERKVRVAHVLIRTNRAMGEAERKAKLTLAHEVHSHLAAAGDFAAIAAQYSEDSVSARNGGEIGWIKEGAIDRRFSEVAFGLEPGRFSEPFETAHGFHLVKVLEGPAVVKRPFEAVEGDIRYRLRNEAKQAEIERLRGGGQSARAGS